MNKLGKTVIFLVSTIVLAAFALSFSAIRELAESNGFSHGLSFLVPLVVDIAISALGLFAIWLKMNGESARLPRAGIFAYSLLSVWLNVGHNYGSFFGIVFSVAIPVTLAVGVEILLSMVEINVTRETVNNRDADKLTNLQTDYDGLLTKLKRVEGERDKALAGRDKVRAVLDSVPASLAYYVTQVAKGHTPNGDMREKFGIAQTNIDRANKAFLSERA